MKKRFRIILEKSQTGNCIRNIEKYIDRMEIEIHIKRRNIQEEKDRGIYVNEEIFIDILEQKTERQRHN